MKHNIKKILLVLLLISGITFRYHSGFLIEFGTKVFAEVICPCEGAANEGASEDKDGDVDDAREEAREAEEDAAAAAIAAQEEAAKEAAQEAVQEAKEAIEKEVADDKAEQEAQAAQDAKDAANEAKETETASEQQMDDENALAGDSNSSTTSSSDKTNNECEGDICPACGGYIKSSTLRSTTATTCRYCPGHKPTAVDCDTTATANAKKAKANLDLFKNVNNDDSASVNLLSAWAKSGKTEYSITLNKKTGTDINGVPYTKYTTFPVNTGTSGSVSITTSATAEISQFAIHTHPVNEDPYIHNFTGPSPGDLLLLLEKKYGGNPPCSSFNDYYAFAYDGSQYDLHLGDDAAALKFYNSIKSNPDYYDQFTREPVTVDGMFKDGTDLSKAYEKASQAFSDQGFSDDDAHDAAMAQVMSASGVNLLKQDAGDTEYKQIDATKTTDKNEDEVYTSTKCK